MIKKYYLKKLVKTVIITLLLAVLFFSFNSQAANGMNSVSLVEEYAPIFYFEREENCYPIAVEYHIQNSDVFNLTEYGAQVVENFDLSDPLISDNLDQAENYFLDNTHGSVDNDGVINHYNNNKGSYDKTVYYRVTSSGGDTVIQYWMFYAFNDGELNRHEGDWEMVQVVVPDSGSKWVGYSQHHSGQRASWDLVEHDNNNIKVYVARGSHANYLRSYSGKLGISADIVGDNGEVWQRNDYTLVELTNQNWLDFAGRWGEVGDDFDEAMSGMVLGKIGPNGPKYRENGDMWNNPIDWGQGLSEASSNMFLMEWFIYNFVTIFIAITAIIAALTIFFIYRRHKKYGLGPRICSILYIDGFNLKSIGNILCIVAIVLAVFGLFYQWYAVSYEIKSNADLGAFDTEGMQNLLTVDGLSGVKIIVPGQNGPTPMGNFILPFSLFIGIGLFFLILKCIGIPRSRKLSGKYIWRGIRLLIPFIIIFALIMAMGSVIDDNVSEQAGDENPTDLLKSISNNPWGGQETITFQNESLNEETDEPVSVSLDIQWGLGLGGWLLIISGVVFIIGGILEFIDNKTFFEPKVPIVKKHFWSKPKPVQKNMSPTQQNTAQVPPKQKVAGPIPVPTPTKKSETKPKMDKKDDIFCPECGTKLKEDDEFCPECGNKKEQENFCPECGTKLKSDEVFCPECGKKI